ncbi:MAG: phospholipase D family protein [Candidatus Thiodiazotropha sp. (ex Codakia rugifera)]|nr:phospholipase D family protein [Candidatus Thiodiazotropha sp. (ex Codakia rugifera)]
MKYQLLKSCCLLLFFLFTPNCQSAYTLKTLEASVSQHPGKSAIYILEKGEESLLARAWLVESAKISIDVQYFIWSTDNIGTLASEALLTAAERGVKVRVIVDDLMIDADPETILLLSAHPNIHIKIYNPKHSVGIGFLQQLWNLLTDFRSANQRMHDKLVIYDQTVAITGGRNMADEYFDYDHTYNFRDRDVIAAGDVIPTIQKSFNNFWHSPLSVTLASLLIEKQMSITPAAITNYTEWLHNYALDTDNYAPEVRAAISDMSVRIDGILSKLQWVDAYYIHDLPGKNNNITQLDGGGLSTTSLINLLSKAKNSILIESPYLIMPAGGFDFFSELLDKGVEISIVTNSLASTDNLQAYSGYDKQKQKLLDLGLKIYEFKPNPAIAKTLIDRYRAMEKSAPIFAIHAKSLVIDGNTAFIGTFNFDPRSANLNTEAGIVIHDDEIARLVEQAIKQDMAPGNSWNANESEQLQNVGFIKKLKVIFWGMLPLEPIL